MTAVDILLITAFGVNFILATFIFIHRKENLGSTFFAIAAYSTTIWIFAMLLFRNVNNLQALIIPTKLLYVAGLSIATNFLYFSYNFLETVPQNRRNIFLPAGLLFVALSLLVIFSDKIIQHVSILGGEKIVSFGSLYEVYSLIMLSYFFVAFSNIFKKYRQAEKFSVERAQAVYVLAGTVISVLFGLLYDIAIPYIGDFRLYWLGPFMTVIFVTATTFSIFRHHLFDIKVIATELFTFSMWIFILTRILLAGDLVAALADIGLLVLTVLFGIFLIRSVLAEVKSREQIQKLSEGMQKANDELKRFDKTKSEFVSIAGHQLRAPLTVIKGYTSLIQEGTIDALSGKGKEALGRIRVSTEQLIKLVSDFLNLSRIEAGKIKYEFKQGNFPKLVEEVVSEFKITAEKKGIKIIFANEAKSLSPLAFDPDKMREAAVNLVDNAIKYSKPGGEVTVTAKKISGAEGERIRVEVKDSGLGIKKEDIPRLFIKFARTVEARKSDPAGMGIGLYFVKRVVEDHGGRVGAESEGVGKGGTFWFELPVKRES